MASTADEARARIAEGRAHVEAWRLPEARASFERAVELFPEVPASLHALAMVLVDLGDDERAEALLRRAVALPAPSSKVAASVRAALGHLLLAKNAWREGFQMLEGWRNLPGLQEIDVPESLPPRWRGEPLDGKRVVVWPVEGLGDQLMYARFVPQLAGRATYVAHAPLARLFRKCAPFDTAAMGTKLKAHYHITSSALALHFLADFAPPPPPTYLRRPWLVGRSKARIGVKVRGNPAHWNDAHRSLPEPEAARLLSIPGAVNLEPEAIGARDLYDTAKLIAGLDLVVSVDTSMAHLAASMGKPTWVLLPAQGLDWRWGRGRDDSVWYPRARLFRQARPNTWGEVIDRVLGEIATSP